MLWTLLWEQFGVASVFLIPKQYVTRPQTSYVVCILRPPPAPDMITTNIYRLSFPTTSWLAFIRMQGMPRETCNFVFQRGRMEDTIWVFYDTVMSNSLSICLLSIFVLWSNMIFLMCYEFNHATYLQHQLASRFNFGMKWKDRTVIIKYKSQSHTVNIRSIYQIRLQNLHWSIIKHTSNLKNTMRLSILLLLIVLPAIGDY